MSLTAWIAFHAFALAMLALDLCVLHRRAHEVSVREAALWSALWIALALAFAGGVHQMLGQQAGLEFLAGYLIEKALSVDNIFVFVLVFSYFGVPAQYQHRVLFMGVLGALLMRGIMIAAGAMLIHRFEWILYVFGALLLITAWRILTSRDSEVRLTENPVLRLVRRLVPVTSEYHEQKFFVRLRSAEGVQWVATPLFIVLVAVETTDLIFAVDSIPAVFAVTREPFLVYTSNVFAILGLRSLYFLLAGVMHRFRYLKGGVAVVLMFVGAKMLLADLFHVPIGVSLGVIAATLTTAITASMLQRAPQSV